MEKTFPVILKLILVSLLLINFNVNVSAEAQNPLNKLLIQYSLKLKKGGNLSIVENFEFRAKDKTFRTIIAQGDKTRIEIEIIKPMAEKEATVYSKLKYIVVENLYTSQTIPYPGALTKTTECPEDKKPEKATAEILGKTVKVLFTNATKRYVIGVWDDDLIKQKAAYAVFYDEINRTHYQIMIFQPSESFNNNEMLEILESFGKIGKKSE